MKKKVLLSFLPFLVFVSTFGQAIHSQVDKRVETLSILARLAGYKEYNANFAEKYVGDIHKYFDAYKSDTIISFMKKLKEKDGIGFDAVTSMATNLDQQNGRFSLIDSWKRDLGRWRPNEAIQFVSLLNAFYTKTHFEDFLKSESPYYTSVTESYDRMMSKLNQSWYNQYYGKKIDGKFNIIIGCANGGQNYGSTTTSLTYGKQIDAIIGSWSFDDNGDPIFPSEAYFPNLVHEFNHSFINPILDKFQNNDTLRTSATILFDTMRTQMLDNNYGNWQTMINESLVRASVVRYLKANNASTETINSEIAEQEILGFIWTGALVRLLDLYENKRSAYPTFVDFYPTIIDFFDSTARHITKIKAAYANKFPKISSVAPFVNNARDVDPNLKEMKVYFNRRMLDNGHYSINAGEGGMNTFPITKVIGYSEDKKSLEFGIRLKPDTEYKMILTGIKMEGENGFPLENYTIKFKTRKL